MNLKKKIAVALLALTLAPAYVVAQEKELKATVVSKDDKSITVKSKEGGEQKLAIGKSTQGVENAKEGAKVTIKYTEKDGQLRASEINPR
jgi:maltose-binding protein MalE